MGETNCKIVIPVSQQESLEVIFQYSPSACGNKTIPKLYTLPDASDAVFTEISPEHYSYKEMLRLLRIASQIISRHVTSEPDFMVATVNGFRFIRSVQILYFEYSKEKKQWEAVLTDKTCLPLKRSIIANDILAYSSSFIRIHMHHIINLNHLFKIEDRKCVMDIHTDDDTELIISRNYLKELWEKIAVL
jgi:LytTr DNA-binding domain.